MFSPLTHLAARSARADGKPRPALPAALRCLSCSHANSDRATYEVQTDLQVAGDAETLNRFVSRLMQAQKA
jgi:hypothetical protein